MKNDLYKRMPKKLKDQRKQISKQDREAQRKQYKDSQKKGS